MQKHTDNKPDLLHILFFCLMANLTIAALGFLGSILICEFLSFLHVRTSFGHVYLGYGLILLPAVIGILWKQRDEFGLGTLHQGMLKYSCHGISLMGILVLIMGIYIHPLWQTCFALAFLAVARIRVNQAFA